jgi:hypothetical protein
MMMKSSHFSCFNAKKNLYAQSDFIDFLNVLSGKVFKKISVRSIVIGNKGMTLLNAHNGMAA